MLYILNGPNLNLLGQRDPDTYGRRSLDEIESDLRETFSDVDFEFHQSNHEGMLIDRLHEAHTERIRGVVFNPGGFTHTSVALRDAVAAIIPPVVEVHLSNIAAREPFRRESLIAPVCVGSIVGLGAVGYRLAVRYLLEDMGDEGRS